MNRTIAVNPITNELVEFTTQVLDPQHIRQDQVASLQAVALDYGVLVPNLYSDTVFFLDSWRTFALRQIPNVVFNATWTLMEIAETLCIVFSGDAKWPAAKYLWEPPKDTTLYFGIVWEHSTDASHPAPSLTLRCPQRSSRILFCLYAVTKTTIYVLPFPNTYRGGFLCPGAIAVKSPNSFYDYFTEALKQWGHNAWNLDLADHIAGMQKLVAFDVKGNQLPIPDDWPTLCPEAYMLKDQPLLTEFGDPAADQTPLQIVLSLIKTVKQKGA